MADMGKADAGGVVPGKRKLEDETKTSKRQKLNSPSESHKEAVVSSCAGVDEIALPNGVKDQSGEGRNNEKNELLDDDVKILENVPDKGRGTAIDESDSSDFNDDKLSLSEDSSEYFFSSSSSSSYSPDPSDSDFEDNMSYQDENSPVYEC